MAIAIVQHVGQSSAANSTAVTGTITSSTAGSILIVGSGNGSVRTVTGVVDNLGNVYTQMTGSIATGGSGTANTDLWYFLTPAAGVTGITITYSGAAGTFNKDIFIWEVSGFVSPIADVAVTRQNDQGNSNVYTGPTAGPISANGIAIAVMVAATTIDQNPLSGNTFTSGGDISPSGTAGCSLLFSSFGSYQPNWHAVGTANFCSSVVGIFCEAPASVAGVQFDAATTGPGVPPGSTTTSWLHPCNGANGLLVVEVAVGAASDAGFTTGVTYNSVAMTSASKVHSNAATQGYVELFYLKNPSSGFNTVVVTITGGTGSIETGATSFNNVDQTTPIDAPATATGASTTPSVGITSQVGDIVVDGVCCGSAVTGSNKRLRWLYNVSTSTQAGCAASSLAVGAAGTVTMSYAVTSDSWGIIALNVNAAAAPPPSNLFPADMTPGSNVAWRYV